MPISILNIVRASGVAVAVFALISGWSLAGAESDRKGELYNASEAPLNDVQQALARASANGKTGLIVLGANWCHDSRALASRLNESPLSEVIQDHYELVFIDVGYYEDRSDVLQPFGVQQYYATPTVLVVDPSTEQLLDNEERHIWGSAYNISMTDSVEYFEKWLEVTFVEENVPDELQRLYADIDEFEAQQASRVAGGYAVVGPMLKALREGNRPDGFNERWGELRDFRIAIPGDIRALREEARRQVSEGEPSDQLEFLEAPPLSWESE